MNDPIHIYKTGGDHEQMEKHTVADEIAMENARHTRRLQTGFLVFLGILALGFVTPLIIWLGRLAGGW